jgi:hypothetical protein
LWKKQQVNYTLACIWCQDTQSSTCSVCILTLIISFVNNCLSSNLMKIQLYYSYLPASQVDYVFVGYYMRPPLEELYNLHIHHDFGCW